MHVLTNAVVHTMDDACSTASALAWDDGGIIAVGDNAEVRAVAGDGAVEIDGDGRAVLPGFVDAHHHLSYTRSSSRWAWTATRTRLAPSRR